MWNKPSLQDQIDELRRIVEVRTKLPLMEMRDIDGCGECLHENFDKGIRLVDVVLALSKKLGLKLEVMPGTGPTLSIKPGRAAD